MSKTIRRILRSTAPVLLLLLVSRIALTGVGVIARTVHPPPADSSFALRPSGVPAADAWAAFDSWWYLKLGGDGYAALAAEKATRVDGFAFPPLYPVLIHGVRTVVRSTLGAALVVSNLALLGAAFLLGGYARTRWGEAVAQRTTLLLFLWPTGFYHSAPMSESLFLLLAVATFVLLDRHQWWWASAVAAAATLTRTVGVALAASILLAGRSTRRFPTILALLAIPAAVGLFFLYGRYVTGDWLAPLHAQLLPGWVRHWGNPFITVANALGSSYGYERIWAVIVIAVAAAIPFVWSRLGAPLAAFAALIVLIPLGSAIYSMVRFTAVEFPLILLLAVVLRGRRFTAVAVTCAALQLVLMALWATAATPLVA